MKEKLLNLISKSPVTVGQWEGYDLLGDLHNEWLREFLFSTDDVSIQAHRGSYKTTVLSVFFALHQPGPGRTGEGVPVEGSAGRRAQPRGRGGWGSDKGGARGERTCGPRGVMQRAPAPPAPRPGHLPGRSSLRRRRGCC